MYLLDTVVLSELRKRRRDANVENTSFWISGTTIVALRESAGTSSSVVSASATTSLTASALQA